MATASLLRIHGGGALGERRFSSSCKLGYRTSYIVNVADFMQPDDEIVKASARKFIKGEGGGGSDWLASSFVRDCE